jgi:type IV secretion system protein VirD4
MFNVSNAFAPWSSELISAATQSSDFDIRALRRERISIFIGTPLADLESYRPIVRILFQQIHDVLMREMPGAGERYQVLLLLDEFFALGKMSSLASKIAVSAGYGFKMAIILQNISQLDEIYGRATRETMVSGTAVKLFVAINDNETAKYVSNALGTYTATTTTKIPGLGFGQSRVSIGQMAAPLRRAEELTRMAADKSIVLVANARPFEVRKLFYYRSGSLKRLMARGKKVAVRIPKLREWIDSPIWTDGARVELPSATQAAPVVVFPQAGRPTPTPAPKAVAVLTGDNAEPSASLNRAAVDARPKISVLNEEIEAKLATALSTIDEELASAGPETVAPLKDARDKLEATARRIKTEWVQA